jgi:hypothetical protein
MVRCLSGHRVTLRHSLPIIGLTGVLTGCASTATPVRQPAPTLPVTTVPTTPLTLAAPATAIHTDPVTVAILRAEEEFERGRLEYERGRVLAARPPPRRNGPALLEYPTGWVPFTTRRLRLPRRVALTSRSGGGG